MSMSICIVHIHSIFFFFYVLVVIFSPSLGGLTLYMQYFCARPTLLWQDMGSLMCTQMLVHAVHIKGVRHKPVCTSRLKGTEKLSLTLALPRDQTQGLQTTILMLTTELHPL